jgi:hypothetical protein
MTNPTPRTAATRLMDVALTARRMVEDGHPSDRQWFDIMSRSLHEVVDLTDAAIMGEWAEAATPDAGLRAAARRVLELIDSGTEDGDGDSPLYDLLADEAREDVEALRAALAATPDAGLRPPPTCGTEPPFDPEGCGHDHHGALVCGEIVDTAWSAEGADPVYCEHIDRRYAQWLERLAATPSPAALDVERLLIRLVDAAHAYVHRETLDTRRELSEAIGDVRSAQNAGILARLASEQPTKETTDDR